eukprot:TRINITY_DN13988_c0_g1_i2.p1 TRINITY_DN13988_c0_g1~~TRINITY_DN13988_c0_g1_i2.p1  ORF type:complete len:896 (+),score=186.08 TRINITY_DN13988_c0_g1_i2:103-2790(+)
MLFSSDQGRQTRSSSSSSIGRRFSFSLKRSKPGEKKSKETERETDKESDKNEEIHNEKDTESDLDGEDRLKRRYSEKNQLIRTPSLLRNITSKLGMSTSSKNTEEIVTMTGTATSHQTNEGITPATLVSYTSSLTTSTTTTITTTTVTTSTTKTVTINTDMTTDPRNATINSTIVTAKTLPNEATSERAEPNNQQTNKISGITFDENRTEKAQIEQPTNLRNSRCNPSYGVISPNLVPSVAHSHTSIVEPSFSNMQLDNPTGLPNSKRFTEPLLLSSLESTPYRGPSDLYPRLSNQSLSVSPFPHVSVPGSDSISSHPFLRSTSKGSVMVSSSLNSIFTLNPLTSSPTTSPSLSIAGSFSSPSSSPSQSPNPSPSVSRVGSTIKIKVFKSSEDSELRKIKDLVEKMKRQNNKKQGCPEVRFLYLPQQVELNSSLCELTEMMEIMKEAEIAHYQENYESSLILYNFLEHHVTSFHLYYRLAQYYRDGLGKIERDHKKSKRLYKKMIQLVGGNQGVDSNSDPLALYDLANLYVSGMAVERDYERATKLYILSAEKGNVKSQYSVGFMYASGKAPLYPGENQNAMAFKFYSMAADNGHPRAQCNLGVMYQLGDGVEVDHFKALECYRLASDKDYPNAHYNMGLLYQSGLGVTLDYSLALNFYEKAVAHSHANAEANLATLFRKGCGVTRDYKVALRYYHRAANHGCVRAYYFMGNMYRKGQGVEKKDYETALKYYDRAAKQNYWKAYNKIGLMYARGKGIQKDYKKAVEYYTLGANRGSSRAQYNLGVMYECGKGIEQNYSLAFRYFKLSADQGYVKAQYNLGWMYQNGRGVGVDNELAIFYFTLAAEQKNKESLFYLGWMYYNGSGVQMDTTMAEEYWKLAAFLGYQKARTALEKIG